MRALAILFALLVALAARPAAAHDFWINWGGYKNAAGVHCCGENDCPEISSDDMQSTPAGWRVISTGEVIPYSETQVSEDGKFYRCHKYDGSRRCFFAPVGSS